MERDGVVTVARVLDSVEAELVAHVRDGVGLGVLAILLDEATVL